MDSVGYRKGNYGVDAPNVVRNLILLGIACLILSILSYNVFPAKLQWLGNSLGTILLITFLIGCGEGVYMVWSSKVGKFRERERLLDLIPLRGDELVLDAGCGRGLLLNEAARRLTSGKAVGLDIWNKQDQSGNHPEATLANARVEGVADRVEVVDGDMRQIPFPDNHFDAVVSSLAIHNIKNKEDRDKALAEIVRVLKKGGRFALLDFQHVRQYAETLQRLHTAEVKVIGPHYQMFPPVRIVKGRKK
ncbi:class I SAM-dependent methyltransferase [Paenibacillus sp. J2TS4]|uniref:class I SAM-dependent methyltransferase n=1 Tax=Paenibacillus sp. J2TS4 TaxID=2807194 RepID=UPI001B079C2B|nr:class I SAM-dependent methyltransferase [Paenibacillus sp. J2TS4]GIP32251.1 type 11 methyltransferase [Paenibacillus sp. J2TS4]